MALIKCNHCGNLISDKATRCPKCGNVVIKERPAVLYEEEDQKSGFKKFLPYILGTVVVLGIAGYFLFTHSSKDSSYEDNGANTVAVDTVTFPDFTRHFFSSLAETVDSCFVVVLNR